LIVGRASRSYGMQMSGLDWGEQKANSAS